MGFEDVIDMMLSLLQDYNVYDDATLEELQIEAGVRMNMVIARAQLSDLAFDTESNEFVRSESTGLSVMEATILAYGLLMMWLSHFVNNSEVLSTQLSSKEVTQFSNANRIQQGIALYKLAKTEFYQLVIDYDALQTKSSILKDLEGGN